MPGLAPHVHLAHVDGQAVLLDLRADQYVALESRLAMGLECLLGDRTETPSGVDLAAVEQHLRARGYLDDAAHAVRRAADPVDAVQWPSFRPAPLELRQLHAGVSALRALTDVAWSLRRRNIAETIAWLQRARAVRRRRRGARQALLDAYHEARPLFPVKPVCRLDAPAICLHLWRKGWDADLVFGVRLNPFAAHCWAQAERSVLNEPPEFVQQYTPIMTV
jgi:hypothetical protein